MQAYLTEELHAAEIRGRQQQQRLELAKAELSESEARNAAAEANLELSWIATSHAGSVLSL